MAKDAGKKSFLDFFKVKNIDDDEDEFDDDLFDDDDYDDDDDDDYEDVKPRAIEIKTIFQQASCTFRFQIRSSYTAGIDYTSEYSRQFIQWQTG